MKTLIKSLVFVLIFTQIINCWAFAQQPIIGTEIFPSTQNDRKKSLMVEPAGIFSENPEDPYFVKFLVDSNTDFKPYEILECEVKNPEKCKRLGNRTYSYYEMERLFKKFWWHTQIYANMTNIYQFIYFVGLGITLGVLFLYGQRGLNAMRDFRGFYNNGYGVLSFLSQSGSAFRETMSELFAFWLGVDAGAVLTWAPFASVRDKGPKSWVAKYHPLSGRILVEWGYWEIINSSEKLDSIKITVPIRISDLAQLLNDMLIAIEKNDPSRS